MIAHLAVTLNETLEASPTILYTLFLHLPEHKSFSLSFQMLLLFYKVDLGPLFALPHRRPVVLNHFLDYRTVTFL